MEYYDESAKYSNCIWTDVYRPRKKTDLMGNTSAVLELTRWLNSFPGWRQKYTQPAKDKKTVKIVKKNRKDIPKSSLIVVGNHGTGKTQSVLTLLHELDYQINILNFDKIREMIKIKTKKSDKNDKNIFNTIIERLAKSPNVVSLIRGHKNYKMVLLIDEIEAISSSADKKIVSKLIKLNDQRWFFPIIMISNNQHNKLLTEIKKNSCEVRFWPLAHDDMRKILLKIVKKEQIKLSSEKVVQEIISSAHGDIRQMIHILQGLTKVFPDQVLKSQMVKTWQDNFYEEDLDDDLFEASGQLLKDYTGIEDQLRCYETDKVLIPLMVHQNYHKRISSSGLSELDQLELAEQISESFSSGDISENYIYGHQNWDLQRIHGFEMCVYTSFHLNQTLKQQGCPGKLIFPQDLNKTSIMRINRKNIDLANSMFRHKSVPDYLQMNYLLMLLLIDGRIPEATGLCYGYAGEKNVLEALFKIDKITNPEHIQSLLNKRGLYGEAYLKKLLKELVSRKRELLNALETYVPEENIPEISGSPQLVL